jgi:hypothetical protein
MYGLQEIGGKKKGKVFWGELLFVGIWVEKNTSYASGRSSIVVG